MMRSILVAALMAVTPLAAQAQQNVATTPAFSPHTAFVGTWQFHTITRNTGNDRIVERRLEVRLSDSGQLSCVLDGIVMDHCIAAGNTLTFSGKNRYSKPISARMGVGGDGVIAYPDGDFKMNGLRKS